MNESLKRFIGSALPIAPQQQRELVVVPPPPLTLDELATNIRAAHADVEAALLTAVERALDAGLLLKSAKARTKHGAFEDYVASCRISMRTAQNYMRIARYEVEVRQLLAEKTQGNAHLSISALLKFVQMLEAKKKPKRKAS